MKRLAYLISLTLVLVGCGSRNGYFKLEGHLLNLNQGEFYIYSIDGAISGVDTIKVEGGRFTYEIPCAQKSTLVLVFPNFSETPVFASPNEKVSIEGDASHLKEIEIKGTDENKLMTSYRQQVAKASPPEEKLLAKRFIENNAGTLAAVYLLRKDFVTNGKADLNETEKLAETVYKAQPKNGSVARMTKFISMMKKGSAGSALPTFTAQDVNGKTVSTADLRGKVAVVITWATWNYESKNQYDRLKSMLSERKGRLVLMGINIDASKRNCKQSISNDSTSAITICDQQMFESPLMEKFAMTGVPDNIIYNAQGRIIERGLSSDELVTKIKTLLN